MTTATSKRPKIRTLQPGEPKPDGDPGRYRTSHGYIELRWFVAPNEYVRVYEHRLVMGLPDGHVHHKDGDKTNNCPSNLEVLDAVEHARHHALEAKPYSRSVCEWNGLRSRDAFEKQQARLSREQRHRELLEHIGNLYKSGLTTAQIGEQIGRDPSMVSRTLKTLGIKARGSADYLPPIDLNQIRIWHAQGVRAAEMQRRLGVGRPRIDAALDELGLPRFSAGRPDLVRVPHPRSKPAADGTFAVIQAIREENDDYADPF